MGRWQALGVLAVPAGICVSVQLSLDNAGARDRPGTPNKVQAYSCNGLMASPSICVEFYNTATEKVFFDIEGTRNGGPLPPNTLGGGKSKYQSEGSKVACIPNRGRGPAMHGCAVAYRMMSHGGPPTALQITEGKTGDFIHGPRQRVIGIPWKPGKVKGTIPPQGVLVRDLEPQTKYCFRFRARTVSGQIVSEKWSGWACAETKALPPKPAAPTEVSAQNVKPDWDGATQDKNKALPNRVVIRWKGDRNAGRFHITVSRMHNLTNETWVADSAGKNNSFEKWLEISQQALRGGIEGNVCAENIVGNACTKFVSTPAN